MFFNLWEVILPSSLSEAFGIYPLMLTYYLIYLRIFLLKTRLTNIMGCKEKKNQQKTRIW